MLNRWLVILMQLESQGVRGALRKSLSKTPLHEKWFHRASANECMDTHTSQIALQKRLRGWWSHGRDKRKYNGLSFSPALYWGTPLKFEQLLCELLWNLRMENHSVHFLYVQQHCRNHNWKAQGAPGALAGNILSLIAVYTVTIGRVTLI